MLHSPRPSIRRLSLCLFFITLVSIGPPSVGQQAAKQQAWPQFLGPQRNGKSAETGLIDRFPDGGPKEVWRATGGVGKSGLAISNGKLFTLVQHSGKQFVVALDAKTGNSVWQAAVAPEFKNQMGDGPRATPAVAGDRVFVFTGQGILSALKVKDGSLVWSHDVVKELGGRVADYGMACSPLVVDDLVYITAGARQGTVAAYDTASGKLVWKAGSDPAGYSSAALLNVGGTKQLVTYTGNSVLGIDHKSGEVLWRYPYVTDFECNIATPLEHEAKVFVSSGENHGSVLLNVQGSGGRFEVGEVWKSQGSRSTMRNEWQTSILIDGYLYGFDNVGSAGPVTHLTCVEASTGKRVWQKPRFGKGNLIAADGKLFISTMKGEFVLVRATPDGYEELGRTMVIESTRQAPALCNGLLYLRDDSEIVCLDVSSGA